LCCDINFKINLIVERLIFLTNLFLKAIYCRYFDYDEILISVFSELYMSAENTENTEITENVDLTPFKVEKFLD